MNLEDVAPVDLDDLVDDLADLRHDLGKYVGFETRFAGPDADVDTLRAALRTDLISTRRRGDASLPAWDLWERLRPTILDGDPDVVVIDDCIAQLRAADLSGDLPALERTRDVARRITEATRRLHARALQRLDGD